MKPVKNPAKETTLESLFPLGCTVKYKGVDPPLRVIGYDWCTAICSHCPTEGHHFKLTHGLGDEGYVSCPGRRDKENRDVYWSYRRVG